jgi:cytochrome c-type biogenesis protein CcmH/NrfG
MMEGDFQLISAIHKAIWATVLLCSGLLAGTLEQAQKLYDRTEYAATIKLLQAENGKDGNAWALLGQSYFMLADYKRATGAFEQAVAAEPQNSEFVHWLGRTWGRRAELSNPLFAPTYASRARQCFERAVALDAHNGEALNDLFDYYLEAPGFLGGGFHKAEALVGQIAKQDPAEGYFARAQLADRRSQFNEAEEHLRRALDLAPGQVGRVLDLASYLSKHGRVQESETAFARAQKLAPDSPQVLYRTAETYVRDGRNLDKARVLLEKYLGSSKLTPDDPPRAKAEELLQKTKRA